MAAKVREVAGSLPLNTLVDLVRAAKERQDLKGFHAFEAVQDILEETPKGWRAAPTVANILERVLAARARESLSQPAPDQSEGPTPLKVEVDPWGNGTNKASLFIESPGMRVSTIVTKESLDALVAALIEELDWWDEETKGDSDEGG